MAKKTTKTIKSTRRTYKITGNTLKSNYLNKIEENIQSNQSKVSMILGGLIILVVGLLVFNYFSKGKASLGPAQQAQQLEKMDVAKDNLPGSYTVKEDDTLFTIAQKYYDDGGQFDQIAQANNLTDPNQITAGQVLQIPKLQSTVAEALESPTPSPVVSPSPEASTEPAQLAQTEKESAGTGTGGGNSTIWGDRINGDTYTVVEGDWLSKIAGRAYGNIYSYEKIAQANNISDPDYIEPGQVLTIPR